jgi:hypothetical protein
MTAANFDRILFALLERKPFHPFTIELANGNQFKIDHPFATVVRDGVAVFLKPGGVPVWFDHDSVVQINDDMAHRPG